MTVYLYFLTCIGSTVCGLEQVREESTSTLRLEDLLIFVTGSDSIPPMGFEFNPVITFVHDPPSHLPLSNTCTPSLHLPVISQPYDRFKDAMVEALVGGIIFGKV